MDEPRDAAQVGGVISFHLRARQGVFTLDARLETPVGVTALFGPSGAGKTSIIRAMAGLLPGTAGYLRIGERVLFDSDAGIDVPVRDRRIGYVFQDARLFPHLTVRQNLRYGGARDEDRIVALLGLAPLLDRRPAGLSGGEAQRVALGRALMAGPDLLLLDEPLAALDTARRDGILPYLEVLRDRQSVPMIYVSHAIAEVARLATHIALIREGRVAQAGPLADILSDPALMPQIGAADAGAVLLARITDYDARGDLTGLAISEARIVLPGRVGAVGQSVRVRVPARGVILSADRPARISAQNVLPVTVTSLETGRGPGVAVGLRTGTDRLLARITRRAAEAMALAPGQEIHAIFKATSIGRADLGAASDPASPAENTGG